MRRGNTEADERVEVLVGGRRFAAGILSTKVNGLLGMAYT